jgi:hypothetical protein
MRAIGAFLAVSLALVALIGWILGFFYASPAEQRAIWVSAGISVVVQAVTFAIMRIVPREHVMAGWGIGSFLRFAVLGLYGLVVAKALGLPGEAALVSLAAFLFVSTIVEPLLLKS